MKKTILATALAALTFTALAPAANAAPMRAAIDAPAVTQNVEQVRHYKRDGYENRRYMSERQLVRHLYRMGYSEPRIIGSERGAYVVHAYGRRGKVQLVVSKRDGDILSRKTLYSHYKKRDHRHGYGYKSRDTRTGFTIYFGNR